MKSSQEDSQAITFLKQELDKTFKVLELSKDREERAKQKIESLTSRKKVLECNLQQFQAMSTGQSNAINDLKERKELLTKGTGTLMQRRTSATKDWPGSRGSYQSTIRN